MNQHNFCLSCLNLQENFQQLQFPIRAAGSQIEQRNAVSQQLG